MSKHDIALELHKPIRKNYTRRRVNVYYKNDLFQADLIDMISYFRENKGYKYILCIIDCFTKFAWALPLKSKKGEEVTLSAGKIFIDRRPNLLQVDRGKEFYNKHFKNLVEKCNIKMYSTYSTVKACVVERFNRTLKEKMFRQFTVRGSYEWVSILPELMNNYNNSKHRTIGISPKQADVDSSSIEIKLREIKQKKIKFTVGDKVRISMHKGVFVKGYLPNWSTEIFTIIKVNKTLPTTFILEDYTGERIAGGFYAEEICKTIHPDEYLVEKVIRVKGCKIFVKWLGFDSSHNSWINKTNLKI